jgi:GcrA cell cycle regulator
MNYHANLSLNCPAKWTEERIAQLTELWEQGLSCAEIAIALGQGATRNAVIGKVHRLGLPRRRERENPFGRTIRVYGRSSQPRPKRKRISKAKVVRPVVVLPELKPLPPPLAKAWEPLPDAAPISLLALTDAVCRWPVGGDYQTPGTGFCGCPVAPGRSYCTEHFATSIGKGTPSERSAIKSAAKAANIEAWVAA